MEDSKKRAEFAKMNRWLTAWIERLRANEDKKQTTVRALTRRYSSMGRKQWTALGKDDDKLYSWFLDTLKDEVAPWLTGGDTESKSFYLRFTTDDLGGLKKHPNGKASGNIGEYMPFGPCQGLLTLQEDIWETESDESNESSWIHELGHHRSHLVSCYSRAMRDLLRNNSPEYISESKKQRKIILDIFSDHIVLPQVKYDRVSIAKEDFKREDFIEQASFEDGPNNTISYSLWSCKGVGESLVHAADAEERGRYFDEWLLGSPMTNDLLKKLKAGKDLILKFDWTNSTCEQAVSMRQEVDRITTHNGVPFRFGGLIYLNAELGNLVGAVNDLVKQKVTDRNINPREQPAEYDPGAGNSFGHAINNLIKLANTLDHTGHVDAANQIDGVIKAFAAKGWVQRYQGKSDSIPLSRNTGEVSLATDNCHSVYDVDNKKYNVNIQLKDSSAWSDEVANKFREYFKNASGGLLAGPANKDMSREVFSRFRLCTQIKNKLKKEHWLLLPPHVEIPGFLKRTDSNPYSLTFKINGGVVSYEANNTNNNKNFNWASFGAETFISSIQEVFNQYNIFKDESIKFNIIITHKEGV